jgi:mono/diheme cytochrome c family protein
MKNTGLKYLFTFVTVAALSAIPALAQDAKSVYEDKCATCHGTDGAGKTAMGKKQKVADVHVAAKSMTADQMIKVVTEGKGNMDGFGKELSKDQIKTVVEYYRGLAK